MTYFSKYSSVLYKFDSQTSNTNVAINVLNSARFVDLLPERSNKCYVDYIVKDEEKPEHIADRVYGRSDYHWIVWLSNRIYNPYFDWPLSDQDFERYVNDKYPGTALFYECRGQDAVQYTLDGSSTKLSQQDSTFVVGNTLTQIRNNATVTGTIVEWNPTYRKLVVDNVQGGSFLRTVTTKSTNRNGDVFVAQPRKVVQYNVEAVHHFVDDFNNYLDPYAKINYYEYDDHKIYARQNIFYDNQDGLPTDTTVGLSGSNDFILNKYINGSQDNAVTNRRYEEILNDAKRSIKVLRTEYIPNVVKQFESMFK